MTISKVISPYESFTDLDGSPLDGGYIFIGAVNLNPETNQIQIYWDSALTQPAPQPLRTVSGYISRNGTPSAVYAASDYSITVKNKSLSLVLYEADVFAQTYLSSAISSIIAASSVLTVETFSALATTPATSAGMIVFLKQHTSGGIGGGFFQDNPGAIANDNGTKINNTVTVGRNWKRLFDEPVHVKWFGAVCDGVTDDSSKFILAQASGYLTVDARGCNCFLGSTINIAANTQWLLSGATLSFVGASSTMFSATLVDNWSLVGPFTVNGDLVTNPGTGVSSKAISVTDCGNWKIIDPTINNVKGYGIYTDPGASTRPRGNGGSVINPKLNGCVWGWHDNPGSGGEYCTVTNIHAIANAEAAVESSAGNTIFVGGHILDNIKDGIRLFNGANNTHGSFTGLNVNHNGQYNLVATQVLNGETFTGCHFYANVAGTSPGSIFLDRCKGINLDGGHLDCEVYNYKDGSSGVNVIENMYMPGGYGVNKLAGSNNGHDQLIFRNCWGPGAYQIAGGIESAGVPINDPSLCYVLAQRNAADTFNLTSGTPTTLPFSATPPFPDRRGVFNFGTGTATIPANCAGLYSVDFDLVFNGTAMNAASSFVEFKINGVSKKVAFSNIFSTTRLQITCSFEINLAVGDALTLVATIVGTTPVFGDSAWPSNFSLKRIS